MNIEQLESVDEMLACIAGHNADSVNPSMEQELQLLSVQTFLKLFGHYKVLNGTEHDDVDQCAEIFNDPDNSEITRQSALAHVYDLFFPEQPEKQIVRKDDKVHKTTCEDCTGSPTHLVVFKTAHRIEEHFLCEDCETAARAEDGDE
jgi:hypothetical protein